MQLPESPKAAPNSATIRFGAFTIDLRAGELRKGETRIALADQTFQLLRLLVERPGEVVTREEIRNRLWSGNTHIDYTGAVNTAIGKIRAALCDSADAPRYIETLPKRGYRFIASVETPAPAEAPVLPRRVMPGRWVAVAVPLALAAAGTIFWRVAQPLPPPRVIRYTAITNDGAVKKGPLFTDGVRLYFNQPRGIAQVSVAGGQSAIVADGFDALALSPDGSKLLVNAQSPVGTGIDRPLAQLPLPAGSPVSLGIEGHDGAWSPDGERIVYAKARSLWIAARDGTRSREIVRLTGSASRVRWSPDGATVRFHLEAEDGGHKQLWQVAPDGANLRQVVASDVEPREGNSGEWTSDGRYFVFTSGGVDLWALRESRPGRPFQLTSGPVRLAEPLPARTPGKIFALGFLLRGELARYDAKSDRFAPWLNGISAEGVVFSRDRQYMAYVLFPEGTLWKSQADGAHPLQLTPAGLQTGMPQWSPDGRTIAFVARRADGKGHWKIFAVPAEGGDAKEIVPGDSDQANPTWSPDGNLLAFAGAPWMAGFAPASTSVRVFDLRTRRISTIPASEGLWSPRWSPDGRFLVAETTESNELRIYDQAARRWQSAAKTAHLIEYSAWSHDSKYVYFNTAASGSTGSAIFRVRARGRGAESVLDVNSHPWGSLGEWFGLAPDDSLLIMRDASAQELYALDVDFP